MILVSACLLGEKVRYDGSGYNNEILNKYKHLAKFQVVCPEVLAGLSIPRNPAEITANKVLTNKGEDVTNYFINGAYLTMKLAKKQGIKTAILKANSPSCGNKLVYDGTFQNKKVKGQGLTAQMLTLAGVVVSSEEELTEELLVRLIQED